MILNQRSYLLRKTPFPKVVGSEPFVVHCSVAIHKFYARFRRQQMPNVVQKSGNNGVIVGPGPFGKASTLQGVFELGYRLSEIRFVTLLFE